MLYLLVLFLALIGYGYYVRRKSLRLWTEMGIPGPQPHWLLGNSMELANGNVTKTFRTWHEKFGPIVGFFIGGHPQLLVTDLELARLVLNQDFAKFSAHNGIIKGGPQPLLHMLAWAHGDRWRQLRATVSSIFTSSRLRSIEPEIRIFATKLTNKLTQLSSSGQEINVTPIVCNATFEVSLKTIIGLDETSLGGGDLGPKISVFQEPANPALESSKLAIAMILFPSVTPIVYPIRMAWEKLRFRLGLSDDSKAWQITKNIVQKRWSETKGTSRDLVTNLMTSRRVSAKSLGKDGDLEVNMSKQFDEKVSNLETQSERLTPEEVIGNALLFIMAGNQTTSVTIDFILHNLVNNLDIQDQLRNDLVRATEINGGELSAAQLEQVPLLMAVIKESMRIYPSGSLFVSRRAMTEYSYDNLVIPKGTGVFIGVSAIHSDPNLWPDPEKFDPSRFIDNDQYDKMTMLSFGSGPRNCVGMRFAYNLLLVVVARLVMTLRIEPGPSTERGRMQIKESIANFMPKHGVFCKMTPIQ